MTPNIFQLIKNSSEAVTILGSNPLRLFSFGEAPEGVAKPYAVWQTITGSPENSLSNPPNIDSYSVQVDVYGKTAQEVRDAAKAVRDAVEVSAYVTAWNGESKDFETGLFRYSFDVDFWTQRN